MAVVWANNQSERFPPQEVIDQVDLSNIHTQPYYGWVESDGVVGMRQKRFLGYIKSGRSHPYDVMAAGFTNVSLLESYSPNSTQWIMGDEYVDNADNEVTS